MSTHTSRFSKPTTPVITENSESWLTKQQAAQTLQVAEKTIDRMAKAGELQKKILKRPRHSPIVVFHPGDVHRAKAARGPGVIPTTLDVEHADDVTPPGETLAVIEHEFGQYRLSNGNQTEIELDLALAHVRLLGVIAVDLRRISQSLKRLAK